MQFGRFFSLLALAEEKLTQALFLSPVVNMQKLIENMMLWSGVDASRLEREGQIATSFGKTLDWDYYSYVKAHPIANWPVKSSILHGGQDQVSDPALVQDFAGRFGCKLRLLPEQEHYFHTPQHMACFEDWLACELAAD